MNQKSKRKMGENNKKQTREKNSIKCTLRRVFKKFSCLFKRKNNKTSGYSRKEEEEVKQRLKDMGYFK